MKAMFLFLLLAITPSLAIAFPIRVDFTIDRSFASWPSDEERIPQTGSGFFLFDRDLFTGPRALGTETVTGEPRFVLQDFSADYMGRHWGLNDAQSVSLFWNYEIPESRLTQADWGPFASWNVCGVDWTLCGADQGTFGSLNGEPVRLYWDVELPEPALALPEPPASSGYLLGLVFTLAVAAVRGRAARV